MNAQRTPLTSEHENARAQIVNFSGWAMPVHYTSILEEARHVRRAVGLFDLCHMGRVRLSGDGYADLVDRLVTCKTRNMKTGVIRYAMLTREDGTTIDDVLVYREADSIFLCINAGNRNRDLAWLRTHAAGTNVVVDDLSDRLAMIALQGPKSVDVARKLCGGDPGAVKYYGFTMTTFCGMPDIMVSRTGYTGEDGYEFYFPAERAVDVWRKLLEVGAPEGLRPIGLGARDTLRLEAGMPLFGHEIDDTTTPLEADLMWAVDLEKDFVGAGAIRDLAARGTPRRLVGFKLAGKRVPRFGYVVFDGELAIGEVRSGTYSPTLETNIGTAYVGTASAGKKHLSLDLRGSREAIEIVPLPFYRRAR
ncbi:MAG: glycine cleavage system aminomethyltransferase GcvT [Planctomycetes bacterium]|nr:glycine cleavage system aminomethyltransferase GcvT [Planctomycetota bacterium]